MKKIRIKGYASKTFVPEMKAVNSGNEEKVAQKLMGNYVNELNEIPGRA